MSGTGIGKSPPFYQQGKGKRRLGTGEGPLHRVDVGLLGPQHLSAVQRVQHERDLVPNVAAPPPPSTHKARLRGGDYQ